MKKNFYSVILLTATLLLSCKKNNDNTTETTFGDTLPEQENLFLDSISVSNPNLNEIVGVNGNILGRSASTATLIDKLLSQGQALSGQKILSHPSEGPLSPQHFGIAYSYGQRDFTMRQNPPSGNSLHKKYSVFGTDCSGLMINLLRSQGVNIANTNVAGFEVALKNAIKSNSTHNQISVTNMGHLSFGKIESGDFIIWPSHIGIVAVLKSGGKIVYQSNGTGEPADSLSQAKNIGLNRGVHPIDLNKAINGTGFWGNGYNITRLKSGIEIGDTLAGGVVFYIDSTGNHGYVCATSDQSTSSNWANAISICSSYSGGGFHDWKLPNNSQLNLLFLYQTILGNFNSNCPDFHQCSYWSIEPNGSSNAWCQYFTTGNLWSNYAKIDNARARAIHPF